MLNISGLCKTFQNTNVLQDVNLTVAPGTILGIAGASGSGKSTLLRCIQGLETPDSGTIECSGKTTFMFQDFQLFPHMSVLENLVYAPMQDDKTAAIIAQAMQLLKTLMIEDKAHAYPHQLSGGQKQRVALARCLMLHPTLLLCDEPTSGLDRATSLDVVSLLQSVKDSNVSMVIASHDLEFLTHIADRIVLLKHGNLAYDMVPKTSSNPISLLASYY